MEQLTGLTTMAIFGMMDVEPRNGNVTWKEWKHFFASIKPGEFGQLLQKARGLGRRDHLAERSSVKKQVLRQLQANQLKRFGRPQDSNSTADASMQPGEADIGSVGCDGTGQTQSASSDSTTHIGAGGRRQQGQSRSRSQIKRNTLGESRDHADEGD